MIKSLLILQNFDFRGDGEGNIISEIPEWMDMNDVDPQALVDGRISQLVSKEPGKWRVIKRSEEVIFPLDP